MKNSRRRGRPTIDDTETLEKIARVLVDKPHLTVRSAIICVVGSKDSLVRRLQRRWRDNGHFLLVAEKSQNKEAQDQHSQTILTGLSGLGGLINSPAMREMQRALNSPAAQQMRRLLQSSALQELERARNSSGLRHLQEAALKYKSFSF